MPCTNVNGLDLYYEVHGAGPPLVLAHGALSTIGTSFGKVLPAFAATRQVVAVELQGHGHTTDIDRPLTYERMADDVAALVRELAVEPVDVFGYSMGGGVALELAMRSPEVVRKVVVASAPVDREGFHPGVLDGIDDLQPEHLVGSPFHEAYLAAAPNPDGWSALVAKIQQLDGSFVGWTADDVRTITAPTLVVLGDADIVRRLGPP